MWDFLEKGLNQKDVDRWKQQTYGKATTLVIGNGLHATTRSKGYCCWGAYAKEADDAIMDHWLVRDRRINPIPSEMRDIYFTLETLPSLEEARTWLKKTILEHKPKSVIIQARDRLDPLSKDVYHDLEWPKEESEIVE